MTSPAATTLQWVITWHHSPLSIHGPHTLTQEQIASAETADCDMILMLDADTGVQTVQVQLCAPPAAGKQLIDEGKMPAPLYTVGT